MIDEMPPYIIVDAPDLIILEKLVNEFIKKGYRPRGDIVVNSLSIDGNGRLYIQAMIK